MGLRSHLPFGAWTLCRRIQVGGSLETAFHNKQRALMTIAVLRSNKQNPIYRLKDELSLVVTSTFLKD